MPQLKGVFLLILMIAKGGKRDNSCLGWPIKIIFMISAIAETNRPPMDLPEAGIG